MFYLRALPVFSVNSFTEAEALREITCRRAYPSPDFPPNSPKQCRFIINSESGFLRSNTNTLSKVTEYLSAKYEVINHG